MNSRTRVYGVWIALIVALAMSGCASTRMTSKVDPAFVGHPFRKLLVHGNFHDLENREIAEDKLCEELSSASGCECVKSAQLFFPGREYSKEEIADILRKANFDGVLILQPTDSGTNSLYIPQTSHTTSDAIISGGAFSGSSTTITRGGYDVSKPWATYDASLYSLQSGDVVWYATAKSSGNRYADWHDLIRSVSVETIEKLVKDGAIPARRGASAGSMQTRY